MTTLTPNQIRDIHAVIDITLGMATLYFWSRCVASQRKSDGAAEFKKDGGKQIPTRMSVPCPLLIFAIRDLGNTEFGSSQRLLVGMVSEPEDAISIANNYKKARGGKYGCIVWDVSNWKELYRINSWNN